MGNRALPCKNDQGVIIAYLVDCPACGHGHAFDTDANPQRKGNGWKFNGDLERPTFSPSMLSRRSSTGDARNMDQVCHSFVRDGKIEYLNDCTHSMAGQTVELPEV